MTELALRIVRPIRSFRRPPLPALVVGVLVLAAGSALAARALSLRGEALPGVRVLGAEVGGATRARTAVPIRAAVGERLARPVTLAVGERRLALRPSRVLALDGPATTEAVMRAGRGSLGSRVASLLSPVAIGRDVAPVLRPRDAGTAVLFRRLSRFEQPAVSAKIALNGLDPVATPARAGIRIDRRALLAAIERAVLRRGNVVRARFIPAAPRISNAAALEAAAIARDVLSGPVVLRFRGERVGTLEPKRLARLLRFKPQDGRTMVVFDPKALARAVEPAVSRWRRDPVSARFQVDGSVVRVIPSRPGLALNPAAALDEVTAAAYSSDVRTAELSLRTVAADLTTREARALGIRKRLVSYTTEMGPSSSNRIWNVHLMADYIDGTIIRPGQTFSFNGVVGPRTAERGFREGQMIVGSLLLPAVGGGVCQTATTLFNNAFELGLPVLRRYNHSWYISHYPLGRDATVSWGGPDLVFKNDLEHAILIKSSYTDSTLTFTFYGTPQGRRVVSATGPQVNWRSPRTRYALDPAAPAGSVRMVSGSNQSGFDVTVFRTVYERGRVLRKDSFTSRYVPVGPTAIYGPGRSIPGPYFVLPTT